MEITVEISSMHLEKLKEAFSENELNDIINESDATKLRRCLKTRTFDEASFRILRDIPIEKRAQLAITSLMREGNITLPEPPKKAKNPEYEERLVKLRKEQENREYASMVRNVAPKGADQGDGPSFREEIQSANKHLTIVLNTVLTVGGSFFFGYKASEWSLAEGDPAIQVLCGIIIASVVLLADIYFIAKTLSDSDEMLHLEKKET